jgi:type VI secretion system protein ImpK
MAQPVASNLSSSGNLALAYQETLTSIVRLKANRQTVSDAHYFRQQFIGALKLANEEGRTRGYSDEAIRDARFAVVAFLDETVLNSRNSVFSDWPRRPLQEELFGVHVGGEVFFQNLERLMRQSDSAHLSDILEVYLLCLTLGYAGKYSASGAGELVGLKQSLLSRILRIRGQARELSPSWRPGSEIHLPSGRDPWFRPLLYSALACLLLLILLFAFYKYSLQSAVSSLPNLDRSGATS